MALVFGEQQAVSPQEWQQLRDGGIIHLIAISGLHIGLAAWLGSGPGTVTLGASGIIFGWLTFLLVFGWLTRHIWQIVASLAVFVIYGGILWGLVPVLHQCGGVSWQGHLCGALAGVLAAYLLSGPERRAREQRRAVAA